MGLTDALKQAQIWPIKAKGKVQRLKYLGDPKIEHFYHESMEQGRLLEKSITDAMNWCQEKKRDLMEKITMYFDMNRLAIDGKLPRIPRAILFGYDSIRFLRQISQFMRDITGLIQAITQNIGILQSMEQRMLQMIQANLNAIANLLHEICNWGLPDIPAIPNLFADTIWLWNGFNFFPLAAFQPHIGFDFNFAFNQCIVHTPNVNIFRNYPTSINTYSGLSYGTPVFVPPLGGLLPNTGQNLSDPNFISQMQGEVTTPWYNPAVFNPGDPNSMWGSVPNPATIFSNFQLPAQTYQDNIVSIMPLTRDQTVEPGDADYNEPDVSPSSPRSIALRKALVHFVTIEQVVDTNFDPYITSAWLFYVYFARNGRAGNWIENFQVAYTQFILPSVASLQSNSVPWNTVLGGTGQTVATPKDIPLVDVLKAADPLTQQNILWKLSYIEAALLGYTRSSRWDGFADANYVSDFTGTDLDYQATVIDKSTTSTILLGDGEADFPTDCVFPASIGAILTEVIAIADAKIQRAPSFRSKRPQFRFIYDQFAQAKEVDRFSQFWREFNANLQALLVQDPYLTSFAVSYTGTLDAAIDPLGETIDYELLKADVATRNRLWTPGSPLLKIPKAPVIVYTNNSIPSTGQNGWQGLDLDPSAFLARPDIQGQPIPVQIAMLRTNLSYAAIAKFQNDVLDTFANLTSNAQQLIQDFNGFGFQVEVNQAANSIPTGAEGTPVLFDKTDFDVTNYVQSQSTFVIQNTGTYTMAGQLNWNTGDAGARTVTVFNGTQPIFTAETDPNAAAPITLQFSANANFSEGDIVSVRASHTLSVGQQLAEGSFFSMFLFSTESLPVLPESTSSKSRTYVASANFPVLTALRFGNTGKVNPVDPTTVLVDGGGLTIYPYVDAISLTAGVIDMTTQIGTTYGGVFSVPSANLIPGGLMYAGVGGVVTQDFDTLVTQVQWVICVGRAIDTTTFIFEPHIPSRTTLGF